jgi:hypothetical protein
MGQTAVEWLERLFKEGILIKKSFEIAKQKEKEQIIHSFNEGMSNSVDYFGNGADEAEQYYKETYNNKNK